MAKRIGQYVITQKEIGQRKVVFENRTVTALGIQAAPGTKFVINGGGPIEMGFFGIYELDLERIGGIVNSLVFVSKASDAGEDAPIIVDYVYEEGGVAL